MSRWGYKLYYSESIAIEEEGIYRSEQEARKEAVMEMQHIFKLDKERQVPFILQIVCFSDTCPPLGLEMERYSRKEAEEYGTGEYLSFGELKSLAKDKYSEGGDGIYECWDQRTFDEYVKMFGPVSRNKADQLVTLRC